MISCLYLRHREKKICTMNSVTATGRQSWIVEPCSNFGWIFFTHIASILFEKDLVPHPTAIHKMSEYTVFSCSLKASLKEKAKLFQSLLEKIHRITLVYGINETAFECTINMLTHIKILVFPCVICLIMCILYTFQRLMDMFVYVWCFSICWLVFFV